MIKNGKLRALDLPYIDNNTLYFPGTSHMYLATTDRWYIGIG